MTNELRWEIEEAPGLTTVVLSGEIMEGSNLPRLAAELSGAVVIDLAKIKRINSAGVREWVEFTLSLRGRKIDVTFDRCSVAIVHQLNVIANFRGDARVRSCFVPYFCTKCNAEHAELLALGAPGTAEIKESLPCPRCGDSMEFDDLPEVFLSFHSSSR